MPILAARRTRRLTPLLVALLFLPLFSSRSSAQGTSNATLPESNEAMILSSRVEEAVAAGDYALAIRLVRQIMDLSGELVADPRHRVYYPVWRRAVQLLRALPPEGVKAYRELVDAEVTARFAAASASGDLAELELLFRKFPIATSWPAIGQELAALRLDLGQATEALAVLREMELQGAVLSSGLRAQQVVALGMIGSVAEARRRLESLTSAAQQGTPAERERAAVIEAWLKRGATDIAPAGAGAIQPLFGGRLPWRSGLDSAAGAQKLTDDAAANSVGYQRSLPLLTPVVERETLLFRARGVLWALDAVALTPKWHVVEPRFREVISEYATWDHDYEEATPDPNYPPEARQLLRGATQHAISAAAGLVFTLEPRGGSEADSQPLAPGFMFPTIEPNQPNTLVARDVSSGTDVWQLGADAADPLYGASFQDAPLPLDAGRLAVLVRVRQELVLLILDAATGRELARTPIAGPPTHLPMDGGRGLLAADETTIYVTTGNGVVAAISRADYGWRWAATYSTRNARRGGFMPWRGRGDFDLPAREYSVDRPVLVADVLVAAPVDAAEILAFDRFDGRVRWRIPRGESLALLGATSDGVLLAGGHVECVDPSDGVTVLWRSVPLELTGRPAIDGQRVYVPTRGGVLALGARDGRIVAAQDPHRVSPASDPLVASLVLTDHALLAVTPNTVWKHPDPARVRGLSGRPGADGGLDPRGALALAWVHTQEGDLGEALQILEKLDVSDRALGAARDALLSRTFVALSRDSGSAEERLAWLRRATALPLGEESASDLAVLVGRTLEEAGRWNEALAHYRDALLRESAVGLVPAGGGRRRAAWVDAALRIGECLARVDPRTAAAFYGELADGAIRSGSAALMQRALFVLPREAERGKLARVLLATGWSPELLIDHVNEARADDASHSDQRGLLLDRWEIHVALGMMEPARADAEAWAALTAASAADPSGSVPVGAAASAAEASVAGGSVGGDAGRAERATAEAPVVTGADEPPIAAVAPPSEEEQRRAQRISRSLRKLEQGQEPPFGETYFRAWAESGCELVADASPPSVPPGQFFLTRDVQQPRLVLRGPGGERRREVDAGLLPARSDVPGAALGGLVWGFNEAPRDENPRLAAWPAVRHGTRAAVAVEGGIIGVGMGPERGGGRRLWTRSTAWGPVPEDYHARAAAGTAGVLIAARGGAVELLSWSDGRPRWVREMTASTPTRVLLSERSAIIVTDDRSLISIDARYGERETLWPASHGTVLRALLIDDVLVIRGDSAVGGFDPDTLDRKWTIPVEMSQCEPVIGRPWVLIRPGDQQWSVVDVHSGTVVMRPAVKMSDRLGCAAVDAERLLVTTVSERGDGTSLEVQVQAFGLADGAPAWSQAVSGGLAPNPTQLAGHDRFAALLSVGRTERGREDSGAPPLRLILIDKQDGRVTPARDLSADLLREQRVPVHHCTPLLLVSPARMVVHALGTTVAFGSSER
ncbi:MAG: PQQ-binding-like beta-propeller repeat protein [Planctomycetia bacterium]|nr:MAG: PQQ-binding-like beta-propeller repeat protein [Planctomycetia bacterium]